MKVSITNHWLWRIKFLVWGVAPSSTLLENSVISYLNTTYDTGLFSPQKIKVPYPLIKQAGMSNFFFTLKKCYIFVIKYDGLTWQMTASGLKGNPWIHTNLV